MPTSFATIASEMSAGSAAVDPVGQAGDLFDEVERAREIEGVIDRVQMVEMRRLGELDKSQAVAGVIRVEQVAGKGEEFAAILGLPIGVERIELVEPAAGARRLESRDIRGHADLAAA